MNQMSPKTKPVVMFLLVTDSLSRPHFFRKLPKTIELLNSLNQGDDYSVFDFKIHNINGNASQENTSPILGGENWVGWEPTIQDLEFDNFGNDALWNILRKYGFISMIGEDDCDFRFPE